MASENTSIEDGSSSPSISPSSSSSGSSSSSRTSSSPHTYSGSPVSSNPPPIRDVLDPLWLKAHSRNVNALKSSLNPDRVVEISDSSPMDDIVEDVASSYHARDLGDAEEDEEDLYDFTAGLGLGEAGPSRLGIGKGKSYERYIQMMKDRGELSDSDEEDGGGRDFRI